jgi:enamine deaminase RidA (YjgF/YER057c/UK114 family)
MSPKSVATALNPPIRIGTNEKMSAVVSFNNVLYFAGEVCENDNAKDITTQTKAVLAQIDKRLLANGSDKTKILRAQIFLKNLEEFPAFNDVWKAWIGPKYGPARATVQGNMVDPKYLVEIVITAALCNNYPSSSKL